MSLPIPFWSGIYREFTDLDASQESQNYEVDGEIDDEINDQDGTFRFLDILLNKSSEIPQQIFNPRIHLLKYGFHGHIPNALKNLLLFEKHRFI